MRNLENSSDSGKTTLRTEDKQEKHSTATMGRLNRSFSGYAEPNTSKATYSSYNDFLKNYGSKKFSAVKADFAKSEELGEKKIVKSEIFIQVSDPKIVNGNSHARDTTDFVSLPPAKTSSKPLLKPDLQRVQIQKLTISENFTANEIESLQNFNNYRQVSPTPKSPETVPDEMIYAKTAVLNELMRRSSPIQDKEINDEPNNKIEVSKTVPKQPMTNGIPPAPKLPEFTLVSKPKNFAKTEANTQKLIEVEKKAGIVPPPPPKFLTQKSQSAGLEANTTTVVPIIDGSSNVNKSDPNVKKLVYNTYRGFLGAYNNKANDFVATLPRNMVFKDRGVNKQVESMAAQGQTGPPGVGRHKSDVSDRRAEPPLCVQNAMLTKDKKPFTYTPGGIDLSEIKSPRMARRIERNAMAPGVGDVIQPIPPPGPVGPLPPSALAAMQPALPVQVFPSAPPPPPIPAPANIPPPPPPMMPLPTKSVATSEGVFERPDMTKIIPENPMALLRKTSGVNRRSFIEEPEYTPIRQQNFEEAPKPQYSQTQVQMQSQPKPQPQMANQPQFAPSSAPVQDSPPEVKTSTAQLGSLYIPPLNAQETQQKTVVSPPATPQKKMQTPEQSPDSPQSPLATLNKAPRPWQNQKPAQQELPAWAQRSHSPPPAQQQSPPTNAQPQRYSPPPPQQQQQSQIPASPVPQQQQQQQQPRLIQQVRPPQQQHQPPGQPTIIGRVIIPVQMDAPPAQNNKNAEAVYITQPVILQHPGGRPEANANQQQRFVQPNQAPQQQKVVQSPQPAKNQGDTLKGTRIIPIQIEGASNANVQRQDSKFSTPGTTPATPGSARSFTRQPSWSSTPTQSNSFKVIQKMTNTDGDDDDDQVTIEHSPRNSQHFQQVPADQLRKMKLNESDRDLMNKIKQGVDEENSIHKEVDPRYRGAAIPSKAFRFLQSMTDGSDADAVSASVPRSPQSGGGGSNRGPQVRTIPVQIEGESTGKPYVPPSEQTVQEPKKYTGSAIPSRSFKILQAMTGDTCADVGQANETNENYRFDPSYYWGYNPGFMPMPPPVPPYWQYYCSPCPTPSSDSSKDTDKKSSARNTPTMFKAASDKKQKSYYDSESSESSSTRNTPLPFSNYKQAKDNAEVNFESDRPSRNTPLPFWNCRQSPSKQIKRTKDNGDADYQSDHSRCTPLPFWNYYPSPVQYSKQKKSNGDTDSESDLSRNTPLPFWSYPKYAKQAKLNADTDSESDHPRTTPLPFWGCYSPFYPIPYSSNETDSETEQSKSNRTTPAADQEDSCSENETCSQFWNPYSYYPYFYGYPPPPPLIYPYPFYPPVRNDTQDITDYSSTDEMAYYNSNFNPEKTSSPTPTPTPVQQNQVDIESDICEEDLSSVEDESDTEVEEEKEKVVEEEEEAGIQRNMSLQAIKSVSDINVYNTDYATNCTDDEGDNASEGTTTDDNDDGSVYTEEEEEEGEEIIPHQLSVIYEESERSDASRMIRESSVATTVSVETVTMCNVEDIDQELHYPIVTEPEEEKICQANYSVTPEFEEQEEELAFASVKVSRVAENNGEDRDIRESPFGSFTFNKIEFDAHCLSNEVEETKSEKSASSNEEKDWWSVIGKEEEEIYIRKTKTADKEITEATENDVIESNAGQEDDDIDFWKILEENDPAPIKRKSNSEPQKLNNDIPESLDQDSIEFASMKCQSNSDPKNLNDDILRSLDQNSIDSASMKRQLNSEPEISDDNIPKSLEQGSIDFALMKRQSIFEPEKLKYDIPRSLDQAVPMKRQLKSKSEILDDDVPKSLDQASIDFASMKRQSTSEPEKLNYDIPKSLDQALIDPGPITRQLNSELKKLDDDVFTSFDQASIGEATDLEVNESNKQSSTSSSDSSSVCSESSKVSEKITIGVEGLPSMEKDASEMKMPSIKDRIRALQEASKNKFDMARENTTDRNRNKQETCKTKEEKSPFNCDSVEDEIKEVNRTGEIPFLPSENEFKSNKKEDNYFYETAKTKSLSTKSSVKSFEDISEDEMDSGVTSDVSRHISDNESDFPELKKMTKYQRAATHSRLFKLLQEECEQEDSNDEESTQESPVIPTQTASMERKNAILKEQLEKEKLNEEILIRRESLSLPLNNKNNSESDSFSSSGINSPGSPVINERLVNELVHSLLRRKKGHIFRNMSMEKLHSAAFRILQEELDSSSASFDDFLSPIKSCSPQEFHANYAEYMQYYDSWSEAEKLYQASYDILPSKTFKLIQEQAVMNKTGSISGFLARCPRVLSSKNVHKELISVLESRESPVPNSELETKGAASAS